MNKRKTLAIGIDGASWNYIIPLLEKGHLPNISYLIEKGHKGILRSTTPSFSPVAWSSFITGKNPDKHGIFDWCRSSDGGCQYKPVSARDRKAIPFWHYLNKAGIRVGVLNLPLTFPAEPIEGFFISGFDSPEESINRYYPRNLPLEIKEEFGWDNIRLMPSRRLNTHEDRLAFLSNYGKCLEKQTTIALYLIKKYEVDVLAMNYSINDHLNHYMKEYELIERGLEMTDNNIGRFLEEYPDANYVIFSDHGSIRIRGVFLVYNWLRDNGFVTMNQKKLEEIKLKSLIANILKRNMKNTLIKRMIINGLILPTKIIPSGLVRKLVPFFSPDHAPIFYWPHNAIISENSKVSFCSMGSLGIYLNNEYRGKRLSDSEKRTLSMELREKLLALKDLSGRPLFEDILLKEDIYQNGQFLIHCPDIFLKPNGPYSVWTSHPLHRGIYQGNPYFCDSDSINYYGRHIDDGIFIFSGKDFNKKSRIDVLNITDIPVIILNLNRVSIPDDFDGRLQEDVYSPEFRGNHKVKLQVANREEIRLAQVNLSDEEEKEIKDKLSGLGYM